MDNFDHNNPPAPSVLFQEQIDDLTKRADRLVEQGINEENAGAANDIVKLAGQLAREIDEHRKKEVAPHLNAQRQVNGLFNPLKDAAKNSAATLKQSIAAFLAEQKKIAQRAAEEAARKAAEEAAIAKALEGDVLLGEQTKQRASDAEAEARLVEAEAKARATIKGSPGFRAGSLRITRKARVTDFRALVSHYADHPDVHALVERLANSDIRHAKGQPVAIPGVEVVAVESFV